MSKQYDTIYHLPCVQFQGILNFPQYCHHLVWFEDHYKYKRKDIIKIINQSNEVPSSIILTTSKDYVKIPNDLKKYIREVKINVQFNKKILSKFIIGSIENSV